ncbi:hypothetical protein CHRYSEOSP005_09130 [Chryseobacterium sp. Alg-005]|uniref:hypothetical protein n=1 Tax=Chryseobacterium sp. Alg-005 TaxID=3159516 RepID=UPI0035557DD0
MKHIIFLFLLIVVSCKKSENRKEKVIPKDETLDLKYEILNQLINEIEAEENFSNRYVYNISLKTIYLKVKARNNDQPPPPPGFGISLEYDSIFMEKDSAYYQNEIKILDHFKFDRNRIKTKLQYTNDEELNRIRERSRHRDFWTDFNEKYEDKCIRTLSIPFFNKDKSACVIESSTSCGPLNGSGYTAIYRKINGKWVGTRFYSSWIS